MNKMQQKDMIKKATTLYQEIYKFTFYKIKDRDGAQDIAQNVMEIAISKMQTLKNTASLKSWIMTITTNEINAYFKEIKKYKANVIIAYQDDEFDIVEQVQDIEADILQKLTREESQHNVIKALLKLDGMYQDIIRDHLVFDIQLISIAEKRDINYNTVKSRYKRGLEILKQEFENIEKGRVKDGK